MPKKVGIVATAAAAGMLTLSPLAFANDDRGTTSFSFEGAGVQQNQVNLCRFDQDVDVLPAAPVGAVLPLVSQEQNGNCINVGDGGRAAAPAPPTTPSPAPTTTPPPDEGQTPPADRVEASDGQSVFFWDRSIPADVQNGEVIFEAARACPADWNLVSAGAGWSTIENADNSVSEYTDDGQGLRITWISDDPPTEPRVFYAYAICEPPAA
ncbi:hypothetical protein ACQPZA_07675 [Pseudonocardia xinjiangensis]|uniref:hypothetical protein n=1 Tax=Pseudonocardia xinjiangensis TaxID=75289 RepID=UPI003D8F566C